MKWVGELLLEGYELATHETIRVYKKGRYRALVDTSGIVIKEYTKNIERG